MEFKIEYVNRHSFVAVYLEKGEWYELISKYFKETLTKGVAPRITNVQDLNKIRHLMNDKEYEILVDYFVQGLPFVELVSK